MNMCVSVCTIPVIATSLCQFYRYLLYDKFSVLYDKLHKHMATKHIAYLHKLLPSCNYIMQPLTHLFRHSRKQHGLHELALNPLQTFVFQFKNAMLQLNLNP